MKLLTAAGRTTFICVIILCSLVPKARATDLNAGDILFTGYNCNAATTDAFSFVVMVNLSGTTIISFTDNGWLWTNIFRAGEQTVTWTYTGTLAAGREITISGPSAGAGIAILQFSGTTIGSCSGSIPSLATSGDQIIAYGGTVGAPTLIAGIHMNVYSMDIGQCANTTNAAWDPTCITDNANYSVMPLGLAAGVSTIWLGTEGVGASEQDNARFACAGPLLTASDVRTAVTNPANWVQNSIAPPNITLPSGCSYFGLFAGLPVKLVGFNGNNAGSHIRLAWQTTDEYHFSRFEIEKSTDGTSFSKIGTTNANGGFSYLPFDYEYRDHLPVNGANFYRLKMIDLDGKFKYSSIIKLVVGKTANTMLVSPNPATNEITVTTNSKLYNLITIADMTGRPVLKQRMMTNNQQIDVSKLPPGTYVITIAGAEERSVQQLVIRR